MKTPPAGKYTSLQIAKKCGVSLRQIQWWDEHALISPIIDGHTRLFDESDIVRVRLIAALRKKGLSLQKIRPMLRVIDKYPLAPSYYVSDGKKLIPAVSPGDAVRAAAAMNRPAYVIQIQEAA